MLEQKKASVAVIGAGWAGCSAAVRLASQEYEVTVFEAARTLGGRARAVQIGSVTLDNGQHILLGAYNASMEMMRTVGLEPERLCLRLPLQIRYPKGSGGMEFLAGRLPAPWHLFSALLTCKGLQLEDKLALGRFSSAMRWIDWQLRKDCSVAEFMSRHNQTERLFRLLWRPLCLAALNTPPERASASVFLNVLRDSLGSRRRASDMLIPVTDLTSLFPAHAASFIASHGGAVRNGIRIDRIERLQERWRLWVGSAGHGQKAEEFDAVIIATEPVQAHTLLARSELGDGFEPLRTQLASFAFEPITTCYLQYESHVGLPHPIMALLDDPARQEWGQFVFDRAHLDARHGGLLAVVLSSSSDAANLQQDALADCIAQQLSRSFHSEALASPLWSQVITEKRATFSCTPGLLRPENATAAPGLFLAGDYTASDYPATLESAVRSGMHAAALAQEALPQ